MDYAASMHDGRSLRALGGSIAVLALALTACAAGVQRTQMPDGSYALQCEVPLSTCLRAIEEPCSGHGYDVLGASEQRSRGGPVNVDPEHVHSEARVRCRSPKALFSFESTPPAPSAAAPAEPLPAHAPLPALSVAPPAAGASAAACVPGVSQSCAGPGGCSGAQICADDGRRFGACDCGPPPAAPPSATPP